MTTDIITFEIVFDSGYGEIANVPARFNIDSEIPAELIDVRLQGLILNRDQLIAWTSEAEVEQIEADADIRAIEDGYIEAPHNWQADERRAYQESTGFPFGGA